MVCSIFYIQILKQRWKFIVVHILTYDIGLHFSGEGYKILFEEVTKCIAEKYPDQTPENLDRVIKMQWERDLGW